MNYKDAGVDIEAGNAFVETLKKKLPHLGGFSGTMPLPVGYEKPVLVSGTDGVGTKLKIAQLECGGPDKSAMHGIGLDLVAMCVNDVICCGAEPLYFLDYTSTSKVDPDYLIPLLEGMVEGCDISMMHLLGGETAEHPQHMGSANVIRDLAGFCTGVVEQSELIDGSLIKPGDKIIGIESSGIHSNGYSLIERLLFHHKIFLKDTPELLTPTRIYASLVQNLLEDFPIIGMAHITGGGIPENLPRCLPKGLDVHVDYNSWEFPKIFNKIMLAGEIPAEEMKRVFNLGIGYCLVVPPEDELITDMQLRIYGHGFQSWVIGEVVDL